MLIVTLILLVVLYLVAKIYLSGPDLSIYDTPVGQTFKSKDDDLEANKRLVNMLRDVKQQATASRSPIKGMRIVRKFADELSDDLETDTEFQSVMANGVPCEWAIGPNANPNTRVLFLHGGAFLFGSSKGHRKFTDKLAKISGGVVLSADYRMLPENGRHASINDAQQAYKWLLKNSPSSDNETTPVETLMVAGDSAGGNLALMLSAWSKTGAERKPDAVVAFSPSTDSTFVSPTLKSNAKTDKILGPSLGLVTKLPESVKAWVATCVLRANPANPLLSPLFQDLSNLPPTLIHASSNEILLGEANRYVNKAWASGSDIRFQVWENQVHDWHLFNMGYGSANDAWSEVEAFLADVFLNKKRDEP